MKRFSEYLKLLLKKYKVTKAQLARELNLKRQNYISNITSGIHTPTLSRVDQICSALRCTIEEKHRLIQLAINERTSEEIKKYNIFFLFEARNFYNLFNLTLIPIKKDSNKGFSQNTHLLDSVVFKINGDFLSPFIKKGQKIVLSFSSPIKKGDYIICSSTNKNKEPVCGLVEKVTTDSLKIKTIANQNEINIPIKDIDIKARVMGILF